MKSKLIHRFMKTASSHKTTIRPELVGVKYDIEMKKNLFMDIPKLSEELDVLKEITRENVIFDPNIQNIRFAGISLLVEYLGRFKKDVMEKRNVKSLAWRSLPRQIQAQLEEKDSKNQRLRVILDHVAGMTDGYFMDQATLFHDVKRGRAVVLRR